MKGKQTQIIGYLRKTAQILFILGVVLLLSNCVPIHKLRYVQESPESSEENDYENIRTEKKIESFDNLYIQVFSLDAGTSDIFSTRDNAGARVDLNLISYTVNDSGFINYPFIGDVYLKGLTINQATQKFKELINEYLPNTSVTVKYVGNKITVLGEVRRPGEYAFYNEKVNVFQALGFAGGIQSFGDKSEITLIRELENQISYHKLDVSSKDFVQSQHYYLIPNDILIVNPVRAKYRSLRDFSPITILLSAITTAVSVITLRNTLSN